MVATPMRTSAPGLTVVLCGLIAAFEGFDLQAAGVAAPQLAPFFKMSPDALGLFFSASTFGLMLGAAFGGRLSDAWGRKRVLMMSVFFFGVFSIATGMANSVDGLMLFRFLTGVGLGSALPNLIALVAENTPTERRFTAVSILYAGLPFGGALASLVTVFGAADDWRLVFYAGGLAPIVSIPILMYLLPESGKLAALKAAKTEAPRLGLIKALFGGSQGLKTALLWIGFFFALLTMYLLLNWLPSLLISRGLSRPEASIVQFGFNICGAAGSIATGLVMDALSRRLVIPATFAIAIAALVALAMAPPAFVVAIALGSLVGAAVSGTQAILYSIAPSTYPTAARGGGVGAAVSVGRLGSAAGPLAGAALLSAGQSAQQVLMLMLPALALAGVAAFILTLLPRGDGEEPAAPPA